MLRLGSLNLPWRATEKADPYWDFFINTAPGDPNNLLVNAIRAAPEGAVNPVKSQTHTPEVISGQVKELALFLGADLVGIARLPDKDCAFAVVCAVRSDYNAAESPGIGGQAPVQKGQFVTFIVSAWIRELGYQATTKEQADGQKLAAQAGLGTLSANGRLVAPKYGSKIYVADPILTDLPLTADG